MKDILQIDEPTGGPLGFADRSVGEVALRNLSDSGSSGDWLYLLLEARRVLRPNGFLTLTPGKNLTEGEMHRLIALIGLEPDSADANGSRRELPAGACRFVKPDRSVAGSPRVSIAIPAYSSKYFEESLASALRQSYQNIEILVCDDSSSDDIEKITTGLGRNRPIRYVRNPGRLGARANYTKCFELANGEFVKFLNDDDTLEPHCVEGLLSAFRQAPDISLATSYRIRIDQHGQRLPDQPATRPIARQDVILHGPALANAMLMAGLNIVGEPSTVLFRKSDLLNVRPSYFTFDGVLGHGVIDMTMWSTLLLKGDAVFFCDGLSHFRIHPEQQQADPNIRARGIEGIRNLQAAWLGLGLHLRYDRNEMLARAFPYKDNSAPPPPSSPARSGTAPKLWRYC